MDGYLYVYGGHVGTAHRYSRDNHSLKFSRLDLSSRKQWESLPMDIPMQSGMIVGFDGKVYRIGGSRATN
ncbi:MAG: galactose oxidase, partial [Myxococcota bacterium]